MGLDAAREVLAGTLRLAAGARRAALQKHGARDGRRIALTFDDGPAPATEAVLDALQRHGTRATFFVLGKRIGEQRDLVRRAAEEGHEIANHSWNHRPWGSWSDLAQLAVTSTAIKQVTGIPPRLFRPPSGVYSAGLARAVTAVRLSAIGWDVDPFDWRKPGVGVIADRVLTGTRGGSIILLHDGPAIDGSEIAAVLDEIIPMLSRDYECVTVSELLNGSLDCDLDPSQA